MKYAHFSLTTREGDNDRGGVPLFAYYLQQALGKENCGVFHTCEIPMLLKQGIIGNDTICIVDGNNGLGSIPNNIKVVSIVHGSWKEFAVRNDKLKDFALEAEMQHKMWTTRPNTLCVAVSPASAKYLVKHHGRKADKVILNGVDTELFKPVPHKNDKLVVLHAATDYNKDGHGRLSKIADLCKEDFEFRFLGAEIGEEHLKFSHGDIYIQGSFYEGNSYASLQAMSCGLPIVATETGLFEDYEFNYPIGEIVPWNAKPEAFVEALYKVKKYYKAYYPREWVLENASFEKFKQDWLSYLGEF